MSLFAPALQELPLGYCGTCERDVLSHLAYREDATEQFLCVHCDTPLGNPSGIAGESDLAEHGYAFVEEGGCGKPGCGSGACSRRGD